MASPNDNILISPGTYSELGYINISVGVELTFTSVLHTLHSLPSLKFYPSTNGRDVTIIAHSSYFRT